MIRDEFKEQQEKKITSKEMKKIREMGDRAFYTSKISKLTDLSKAMKFSAWFSLIVSLFIIAFAAIVFWAETTSDDMTLSYRGFLYGGLGLLIFLFGFLWLVLFSHLNKKKIERYRIQLKEISERDLEKKRLAYESLLKSQAKKKEENIIEKEE